MGSQLDLVEPGRVVFSARLCFFLVEFLHLLLGQCAFVNPAVGEHALVFRLDSQVRCRISEIEIFAVRELINGRLADALELAINVQLGLLAVEGGDEVMPRERADGARATVVRTAGPLT